MTATQHESDTGVEHPDLSVAALDTTSDGHVRIHNNVVAMIARLAALRVPGVLEMAGSFVDGLASALGRKTGDRGIRVEIDSESITLELSVVLEYGVQMAEIARHIQREVRHDVEKMTGQPVKAVHVVVQNVRLPNAEPSTQKEEEAT